ncbi:MAG: tRNA (adenosine(37)-N6)-dimethylallyltransferase MiaA [Intrasporangium sp.]|uniref:tRNA (adenosine(37)-N6)-dimethylallyltransferase MiaA n=1 Tax=Intrasporangium sp. TaxID=1925024 RepID=UPI002647517B|nr:tRNA (adenosine(37)-N6)-dimethylallyltransferase MiaA [Intrasporangium sp.]MDN5796339.1 tRNA (adenosine(37)-N6)-dimethylallyltransferase MiaA [Intrasporangium sp.]
MTTPIVAVVGATATGKSDLALELAERLDGEVVNADAMQLYRGMDIGTAKLPPEQRRGIPHHQLDVLEVTQEASVAAYQQAARADLDGIRGRGRVPILVGGSGLYVRAVLDRLEIPPTDPGLRAALEARAEEIGTAAMFERLRALDPAAAHRIQPADTRRIVRALEVIELTGRPFSASLPRRELVSPAVVLGLSVDRSILDDRIDARAARMFEDGLLGEVSALLGHGLRDGFTASRAIGYAQALAVLDAQTTVEQAVADTAQATRRFARRQESWFRPDPRTIWLPADNPDRVHPALVEAALTAVRASATRPGPPDSAGRDERHTGEWAP